MTSSARFTLFVALVLLAAPLAILSPAAAAEPVTEPLTLWFRSGSIGPAPFLSDATLSPRAPNEKVPATAYSTPLIGDSRSDSVYNAHWTWQSPAGFSFPGASARVTFWAASLGAAVYDEGNWVVELYVDGLKVAATPEDLAIVTSDGLAPAEFQVTLPAADLVGSTLTLVIHPRYINSDWPHAILFDSIDYPSRVEILGVAPGDDTPPRLTLGALEAGATSLRVAWTTDEPTTGRVDVGLTSDYGRVARSPTGTTHEVIVGELLPGQTYHLNVTAEDASGNAASTGDLTITLGTDYHLWLHHREGTLSMDEFDRPGDATSAGYNVLGSALATTAAHTGIDFLGIRQVFPAHPMNPGLKLKAGEPVTATLFVQASTSAPGAGTLDSRSAGRVDLELALFAGDQVIGAQTVGRTFALEGGFHAFEYSFVPQVATIPAGSLVAVVRATTATTAYSIGFEGANASSLRIPVEPVLPLAVLPAALEKAMEDRPTPFEATVLGGVPPYTYAWAVDGVAASTDAAPSLTFADRGFHEVTLSVTDSVGNVASSSLGVRVLQRDYVGSPRVVVAVIDTGINPYHETYRRPGIELPLTEFTNSGVAPRSINLTLGPDYASNVKADKAVWDGVQVGELVWFRDTNVLGISMGDAGTSVLDDHGHGTATSATVLDAWPEALVVMVETNALILDDNLPNAYAWAASQPWIDVVSASMGTPGNAPEPLYLYGIATSQRIGWQSGKVMVNSAGNDPSASPTDGTDGTPYTLAITGSQAGGAGKEILSSNAYSDFASNYTVTVATHTSIHEEDSIGGTSFSCPTVAGTVAGAIHSLRWNAGYAGGIQGGALAPGVTNDDLRSAMNKTAAWVTGTGYVFGLHYNGDTFVNPVAPWTQVGWGHLDGSFIPAIVEVVESGDHSLPLAKAAAQPYMRATYELRHAYWSAFDGR